MFFMILLGIIAGFAVRLVFPDLHDVVYTCVRILILPLIVGIGFEYIMYAGRHNNFFTRMFSAPGLWVQRLTTKEPTPDMLQIAIISTKCALRDEFPQFMEFYKERPWEEKGGEAEDETAEALPQDPTEDSPEASDTHGAADIPKADGENEAL
jgi:hypothetical protein